jgi:hypothetical protein
MTNYENGCIIWSDWNTVAIATTGSTNEKTGDMIQIWFIDRNMHPVENIQTGKDASLQCSGCPFASGKGCYVAPMPLMAIWNKFKRNEYPVLPFNSVVWAAFWAGKSVRFGAYGNPSLLPLAIVESIARLAVKHTGYFHNWHLMSKAEARAYGRFFMASCEPWNMHKAKALGLRTFTVYPVNATPENAGIECLADAKGLTCTECGLCDGTERSAKRSKPLPSIWIRVHGYKLRKATEALN